MKNNEFYTDAEQIYFEKLKQLPQPQKSLLKSGDMVVYRNGDERYVLVETGTLHGQLGYRSNNIVNYENNLMSNGHSSNTIMQVYRNNELIMERTEKSEKELKKEELQRKLDEIKTELEGL